MKSALFTLVVADFHSAFLRYLTSGGSLEEAQQQCPDLTQEAFGKWLDFFSMPISGDELTHTYREIAGDGTMQLNQLAGEMKHRMQSMVRVDPDLDEHQATRPNLVATSDNATLSAVEALMASALETSMTGPPELGPKLNKGDFLTSAEQLEYDQRWKRGMGPGGPQQQEKDALEKIRFNRWRKDVETYRQQEQTRRQQEQQASHYINKDIFVNNKKGHVDSVLDLKEKGMFYYVFFDDKKGNKSLKNGSTRVSVDEQDPTWSVVHWAK